ncbi:MAG: DUF3460 family protein [Pseudomonadota bacterium]
MMDKAYVSDFTKFIDQYLDEHPEVVEEQKQGWASFWQLKAEIRAPEISKDDIAADDGYGFAWSAWRAESRSEK